MASDFTHRRWLRSVLLSLRPHQWIKNLFVAAPLVFAKKATELGAARETALAVVAFCALSGAVYIINDLLDVDKDRAHPVKCKRPIASGALATKHALLIAALFIPVALALAFYLALPFGVVALAYLVLNLAYSLALKRVAYLDVSAIALGFLLRVLGGAYAISVPASPWLLACTGLLAAFLGFGKRAHELAQATAHAAGDSHNTREASGTRASMPSVASRASMPRVASRASMPSTRGALAGYGARHLRIALYVLGTATILAYFFYTRSRHTIDFFGTEKMLWTTPFCLVGVLRFLALVTGRPRWDSPTDQMLRDKPFMANLALWSLAVLAIIYWR